MGLPQVQSELEELRQDHERAVRAVDTASRNLEAAKERAAAAEEEWTPFRDKLEEAKTQYDKLCEHSGAIEEEIIAARAPLAKAKNSLGKSRKALAEAEKEKAEAEKKMSELQDYIDRTVPLVEDTYGPRVYDSKKRTIDELKKEKAKLEKDLIKAQQKHGNKTLDQLAEEARKAQEVFADQQIQIQTVEATGEAEKEAFDTRYKFFRKEAKVKAKQATSDFNARLSRKNHAGDLIFDHENERLGLSVSRNSQDADSASTQDARNLSGGERSYTTLAFELAMWEFCATPFRVLDEFDVFMDDTYRKQAVDTLMELCDTQPQRQFLFLTPQDMHPFLSERPPASLPRIIKMANVRPDNRRR